MIDSDTPSRVKWGTCMTLPTFTALLRNALLCVGMPADEVFLVTSHGIRSGVNTDNALSDNPLSAAEVELEASVADGEHWSTGYLRRDQFHLISTSYRVGAAIASTSTST